MQKFVKIAIFVLAVVAGSLWVSNAIVWVGNQAKLSMAAPSAPASSGPVEQTAPVEVIPQSGN